MAKFLFLAQFPVDSLSHQVVPIFVFLLIFALILILMELFLATITRDSVCLFKFPLLNHILVFTGVISLVSHLKHPNSWGVQFLKILFIFVVVFAVIFVVLLFASFLHQL